MVQDLRVNLAVLHPPAIQGLLRMMRIPKTRSVIVFVALVVDNYDGARDQAKPTAAPRSL